MTSMLIGSMAAKKIIEHALEVAPTEACGILTGRRCTSTRTGRVLAAHPTLNIDESPVRYTIDPKALAFIGKIADAQGHDVMGFYHSHTATEAWPSPTDIALAPPSDVFDYVYVIVSVEDRHNPVLRCFRIVDRKVQEVALETVEERFSV